MDSLFFEPFINDRIEAAKEKARRIRDGIIETIEEFELSLRIFIGNYYKIPIFHKYFNDRTLDDLIFEAEIIRLIINNSDGEPRGAELLRKNREEAEELFSDWIKEEEELGDDIENTEMFQQMSKDGENGEEVQWENVDASFLEQAKNFMETGNFIVEKEDNE